MPGGFFDTNIVLYLASGDAAKTSRVREMLVASRGWISVQVLNESTRVLRNKWRQDWEVTRAFLDQCEAAFTVADVDMKTHKLGLEVAERYKVGIFDSMIVAAALIAGCDTLYSEDMHHGLLIDGRLRVCNPFLAS